jgi:hypothetical protein
MDESSMPTGILSELESLQTLEQVMHWAASRKPPAWLLNVVTQDEFTHDVLFEASPDAFLVFDTNWLGAIRAVALLDHVPDADELLERRVASGWAPTATRMRDGDVVLGHAACLYTQQ